MKQELTANKNIVVIKDNDLEYIQFRNLKQYDKKISHCFTTRYGGVSSNECYSMNMGFNRNDKRENVEENFRRISESLKIDYNNMVFSNQIHQNRIKVVNESDRGKGINRKSDIIGYDGLVTNKKNIALVTFYADCVPLFFFDSDKEVIALSHSGWRGTVKEIAKETIDIMRSEFKCESKDIKIAIGPSIGSCCFEVGEEVFSEFIDKLNWSLQFCIKTDNDKWHINLQEIIKKSLVNSGIKEENICMSDICTKCNVDTFFSHRGDQGRTGIMAAIMQLI